jgi:hypothetical protein
MDHRFRFAAVLGAVLFALAIGVASYNMGVARGLAAGATAAATNGGAAMAGGGVSISVQRTAGGPLLPSVADTGAGIAAGDLPKVFDRF